MNVWLKSYNLIYIWIIISISVPRHFYRSWTSITVVWELKRIWAEWKQLIIEWNPLSLLILKDMFWAQSGKTHSSSWKKGWAGTELRAGRTQDLNNLTLDDKEWFRLAAGIWEFNIRFWGVLPGRWSMAVFWHRQGICLWAGLSTGWRKRTGRWDSETG